MKTLLTLKEAAERLGISERRVRMLIKEGLLPAERFGERAYAISESALRVARKRPKVGRPKKWAKVAKKEGEKLRELLKKGRTE